MPEIEGIEEGDQVEIICDGTHGGTKVLVNGRMLKLVESVTFDLSSEDYVPRAVIRVAGPKLRFSGKVEAHSMGFEELKREKEDG